MAYTFNVLPSGNIDPIENGKSVSQGGPGYSVQQAQSMFGYQPPAAATTTTTAAPSNVSSAQQPTNPTSTSSQTDQLIQKLLGQSDMISSQSTGLESKISEIISGIKSGTEASAKAIDSSYNRQESLAQAAGDRQLTAAQESQRGFAVNTAALKQLTDNTKQQVNDLEQRKQELILQGQAAAAGQISQLQLQAIEFQQKAQQQVFTNLLGITNISQQQDQAKTQASQFAATQSFAQQQAMSTVALKYGITVQPGDTLQSVTARAMPLASREEQLQLQKMQSDISLQNAQTAKALADSKSGGAFDVTQASSFADTYYNLISQGRTQEGQAFLANILDKGGNSAFNAVQNALQVKVDGEFSPTNLSSSIASLYGSGQTYTSIVSAINSNPFASADQKAAAMKVAASLEPKSQSIKSIFKAPTLGGFGGGWSTQSSPGFSLPPADQSTIDALNKSLKGTVFGF